nr:hypothetical protein GCM10025699_76800 [Microbacterium flavescens]
MLAAGASDLVQRARPVLDAMGAKTIAAGDTVGQGTALKLAANAWIASVTAATARSVALAESLGLDPQLFLDAISGGQADTPYAHIKGATMITRRLPDPVRPRRPAEGHRPDARRRPSTFDPTLLDALATVYASASERGHGSDDIAAVRAGFDGGRDRDADPSPAGSAVPTCEGAADLGR